MNNLAKGIIDYNDSFLRGFSMKDHAKQKSRIYVKNKILIASGLILLIFIGLLARLGYLMCIEAEHYEKMASELHERERKIKAKRGKILDRNGVVLADNKVVCTVSVIHNQITEPEKVISELSRLLSLNEEEVRKKVEKYTAIERIRSNVEEEIGEQIRKLNLAGVKVDEDYKRFYPYETLASKVLGFTGADNQGIIGLEVKYDELLQGDNGMIYTVTDAKGIEVTDKPERLKEPVKGDDLVTSLDVNIQMYATQLAMQTLQAKEAKKVSIIVMNPQNGEIYAMVDAPEFDLNTPYELSGQYNLPESGGKQEDLLNQMWRNGCISDTYEPGSTFKIITAAAALEEGVVTEEDSFYCPGYVTVADRRIRCHKTIGHGSENFVLGTMNSCNPVFVTVGLRLGAKSYYHYMEQFDLLEKTGIDLPGEAGTIMHKPDAIGEVELATISFGQSFQISPLRLACTVSGIVNGGKKIIPHLAIGAVDSATDIYKSFQEKNVNSSDRIVSEKTSERVCDILEKVVSEGTGKNGYVEGFKVGGKTATSQTLPRGSGKYIASFLGFEPADDPQVLCLVVIHEPQGVYYGGQTAAPVVRTLYENILPYLSKKYYNREE